MATTRAKPSQVVLALSVFLAAVIGCVLGLRWLFDGVQKEVAAALVAGLLAVGGSMFTVVLSRKSEQKKEIDRQIRERLVKAYEGFLKASMAALMTVGKERDFPAADFQNAMEEFTPELMMWGSEEFIKKWAAFRTAQRDPTQMLVDFADLVLALRKDFGQPSKTLDPVDVLRLFVNDLDNPDVLAQLSVATA